MINCFFIEILGLRISKIYCIAAAQALLDRGWGKPSVEVMADVASSYVGALHMINEQLVSDHTAS